jgi:integrase
MEQHVPKHYRKLTASVYRSLFDKQIRRKWGTELAEDERIMALEEWFETMPHSRQVKAPVRGLLLTLFQAAIRWEILERNPVDPVRQSRKRLKTPRVLTPAEFKVLLAQLAEPYKTMVETVACLGLRVSELLGFQWGDIGFENLTARIQRSVVEGEVRTPLKVTMDVHDEAMSDEKQVAHRKILRLVTRKQNRTVMRTASETGVAVSA